MADDRKNRWYQPHSATVIVVIIAACVMVAANCRKSTSLSMRGNRGIGDVHAEYGWPYAMLAGATKFRYEPGIGFFDSRGGNLGRSDEDVLEYSTVKVNFDVHNALLNGGALIGLILALILVCESLLYIIEALGFKPPERKEQIVWH